MNRNGSSKETAYEEDSHYGALQKARSVWNSTQTISFTLFFHIQDEKELCDDRIYSIINFSVLDGEYTFFFHYS